MGESLKAGDEVASAFDHLQIETDRQPDGTIVLKVRGDADVQSAETLRGALGWVADAGASVIVLDLAQLDFIDSSGISVLVDAQLRADRDGRTLVLRNLSAQVERVLTVAGLSSRFRIGSRAASVQRPSSFGFQANAAVG